MIFLGLFFNQLIFINLQNKRKVGKLEQWNNGRNNGKNKGQGEVGHKLGSGVPLYIIYIGIASISPVERGCLLNGRYTLWIFFLYLRCHTQTFGVRSDCFERKLRKLR